MLGITDRSNYFKLQGPWPDDVMRENIRNGPNNEKEFAEYIYDYCRAGNPTKTNLEKTITSLEEGVGSVAFASGMAAISAIIHLFSSGDEIIFTRNVYGGTYRAMNQISTEKAIGVDGISPKPLKYKNKTFWR